MAKNRPARPGSAPTITPAGGDHRNNRNRHNPQRHPPLAPLPKTGILPALGVSGSQWRKTKKPGRTQMQQNYAQFLQNQSATPPAATPPQTPQELAAEKAAQDAADLKNQRQLRQSYLEKNIAGVVDLQAQAHGGGFYNPNGGDDYTDWLKNNYLPQRAQEFMATYDPNGILGIDNDLIAGDIKANPTNINAITQAIGDQVSPQAARQAYLSQTATRFSQPSQFMNPTGRWSWWDVMSSQLPGVEITEGVDSAVHAAVCSSPKRRDRRSPQWT